jgi:hypothetical protein
MIGEGQPAVRRVGSSQDEMASGLVVHHITQFFERLANFFYG